MSTTFIMIKPDAVAERNVTAILGHVERKGLDVSFLRRRQLDDVLVDLLYAEHVGRPFYAAHREFMLSGPVVGALLVDQLESNAVERVRALVGATDPRWAEPGAIRGLYGRGLPKNAIHASADEAAATREAGLFFGEVP